MTPWLSAVVPVHDGARYLGATLAAAAAQDCTGVEFLLYDSGDDDGASRAIASRFADRLTLRYTATPDCKPWTAKTNRGVAEAEAGYVAMLHQDDLWLPGHVAALRSAIAAAPAAVMSIGPSRFIGPDGRDLGPWRLPVAPGLHAGADLAASLIVQNTVAIPSPVICRDAYLAVGGLDDALWYTADWDLYLKLAATGTVHVREAATTAFRVHGSSLTMTGSRDLTAFRAQQEVVTARHLATVSTGIRRRQGRLAQAAIGMNCALAASAGRQFGPLLPAFAQMLALGPAGCVRLLRQTRLVDRLVPRLRLSLSGKL